ncbi:MAG: hypothetical protein KGJ32_12940 [Xanthomonadaceae bacterium]|nr:hypothetical protein [Xanthomonadaceae bacterium]
MHFITIRKLQREFGLSYVAAAKLIEKQRRLAMKPYRLFRALLWCGLAIFVALAFTDIPHQHDLMRWIPLVMPPLAFAQLYLIHRASRAPILAAARALQARGNAGAPSRSE